MIKSMDEEASAAINAMKAGEAAVQGLPAPPAQAQAPAAQNPGAPTARAAQMRTERDAVAARAREALADPMLPPEAKAHVRQMLSELEAQEGQLEEVENQAHSMEAAMAGEDVTGIHSELSAMRRRCEAALMDPHLSAEGKAEVTKMLREVESKQAEIMGGTGVSEEAYATSASGAKDSEDPATRLSHAAMRQSDLEARALAALEDPEISEEGKEQVREMLSQIRAHASMVSQEEAALASAEEEAAAMKQEMASVETMKDELEGRVRQAMNDPDLSDEAKAEVLKMYKELREASVKKEALEEEAAEMGLTEAQINKGHEIEERARAALADPDMPEEAKAQVRQMLASLKQHENELNRTGALAAEAKAAVSAEIKAEPAVQEAPEEEAEAEADAEDVLRKSLMLEKQLMAHLGEPNLPPEAEAKIKAMLKQLQAQRLEATALEQERSKATALESKLSAALNDPDVSEENKAKVRMLLSRMHGQDMAEAPEVDYDDDFEDEAEDAEENGAPEELDAVTSKTLALEQQLMIALQDPELTEENRSKVAMMLAQLRAQRQQVAEIRRLSGNSPPQLESIAEDDEDASLAAKKAQAEEELEESQEALTAMHDLLASKQAQKAEAMEELRAARAEQAELQAEVEKIKANAKEFNLDMASSLTPQGYAENDVESEESEESEEDGG